MTKCLFSGNGVLQIEPAVLRQRSRLIHGGIMQSRGANKGQSCTAVELTGGLSEINSLHVFSPLCVYLSDRRLQRKSNLCGLRWPVHIYWPFCLFCVITFIIEVFFTEHSHSCQCTYHGMWPHSCWTARFLIDSMNINGGTCIIKKTSFNCQNLHELFPDLSPSRPSYRCLVEAHTELPDERKAGRLCGRLSRWKDDRCRRTG